jgi:CheY-like chemotaxis protein
MQKHLLIAHAQGALTETIQLYFTLRGYRVEVVTDGLQCIARLQHAQPGALLLDDDLPCGGGDRVLNWIRDDGRCLNISIVVLTHRNCHKQNGSRVTYWSRNPRDIRTLFKLVYLAFTHSGHKSGSVAGQPKHGVYLPVAVDD